MIDSILKEDFNKRLENLSSNIKQSLVKKNNYNSLVHIVYVMGNTSICGAAKIIFEHANRLLEKGKKVTIVAYFPKPTWFKIECNYIQVPSTTKLSMCIPYCDLIVATYYTHIGDCINTRLAPVIYFEQGDYHLFQYNKLEYKHKNFINLQLRLTNNILTVSNEAAKLIKKNFKQDSFVIHNAIDTNIFYKSNNDKRDIKNKYILMIGNDRLKFKGIDDIISAYKIVQKTIPDVKLYWITPEHPSIYNKKSVTRVFISPSEKEIVSLYQNADIFISGSYFEAFSLPVLEAMACGCPVITTDCIGIRDYIVDYKNGLITKSKNPGEMSEKILELINNDALKNTLIINGSKTIKKFKWKRIISSLIHYYDELAMYDIKYNNDIEDWTIKVNEADFFNYDDYLKFIKILKVTSKDEVYAPVIYKVVEEFEIARWELIAYKKRKSSSAQYCYTKIAGNINSIENKDTKKIFRLIHLKKYNDAIKKIYNQFNNIEDNLIFGRWIIYCLIKLNRYTEAIELINKALDKNNPKYADIYYLYLMLLVEQKDYDKIAIIKKEIDILDEAIIYEEHIADIRHRANEISISEPSVKAIETNNKKGEEKSKMEEMYDFAMQLYNNGLYDEAINSFIDFIDEYDGDEETIIGAYRKIYLCYYYKEMFEKSRKYCYLTFEYTLPRAEECCLIGLTYLKEKKINKAIFWYELASSLKPPKNNDYAIEKDAWTWKPYLQLCLCYYEQGEIEKAFRYNEIAKSFNPNNKSILQNVEFFEGLGYKSNDIW